MVFDLAPIYRLCSLRKDFKVVENLNDSRSTRNVSQTNRKFVLLLANLHVRKENIFVPRYSRSNSCYVLRLGLAAYLFLRLVYFKISEKDS